MPEITSSDLKDIEIQVPLTEVEESGKRKHKPQIEIGFTIRPY